MKKCYAYLRVSDQSQVKKDGFARQEKVIREYAKANKLEIVQIFKEKGVSGTKLERPTLAKMIVALEKSDVTTIIIEKLDRLARDLMVQEAIIRDFNSNNYQLVSALEGADLMQDDATRKLIRQLFGAVAEYEKSMLVLKLRAARERKKVENGKCEGRKGYHESEEGKLLVKRIKTLRRKPKNGKRTTLREVAEQLNSEGITTFNGKQWTAQHVQQAIQ